VGLGVGGVNSTPTNGGAIGSGIVSHSTKLLNASVKVSLRTPAENLVTLLDSRDACVNRLETSSDKNTPLELVGSHLTDAPLFKRFPDLNAENVKDYGSVCVADVDLRGLLKGEVGDHTVSGAVSITTLGNRGSLLNVKRTVCFPPGSEDGVRGCIPTGTSDANLGVGRLSVKRN
jgi:hypothetical protein